MSSDARTTSFWRSSLARKLFKLAFALVLLRLLLAALTPLALQLAARSAGLELEYASSRTSLSGGAFELRDAQLRLRRDGDAPAPLLAHLGRLELDVDLASALRGELRVPRAQVDGLEVWVEIDRAGRCAWSDVLRTSPAATTEPQEDAQPLSFELPLDLAAQLLRGRLHVRDASVAEPVELDLQADARVEARDGRGSAVVWLSAGGALRQARVEANFETDAQQARAGLRASFDGLTPDALRGWLARAGVVSRETLHGSLEAHLDLNVRAGAASSIEGRAVVRDVRVAGAQGPHFTLRALEVELDEFNAERVALRRVALREPRLWAQWNEQGAPEWAGLATAPTAVAARADDAPNEVTPSKLRFELAQFVLAQGAVEVRDAAQPHNEPLELADAQLEFAGLQWPPDSATTLELAAHARAPGVAERLKLDARAELTAQQLALDAKLHSDGVTLERLAPALARAGLTSELRHGTGAATLRANLDWSAGLSADAAVLDVRWSDGEDLFRLERATLNGASSAAQRVSVRQIECVGLRTSARRGSDGKIRALGFVLAQRDAPPESAPSTASGPATGPATGASGASPTAPSSFSLDSLQVRGAAFEWLDELPQNAVELAVRDAELDLERLDLGAHTAPRVAQLRAVCKADPLFEQARLDLQLASSKEQHSFAGEASVEALDLTPLAPYLSSAGLTPRCTEGRLQARMKLDAQRAPSSWLLTAQLLDAELSAGGERLAGVESVALDSLALRELAQGLEFRTLMIERPFVRIERSAAGALSLCGVELSARDAQASESSAPPQTQIATSWLPFSSRADSLALREGRVEFHDAQAASTAPLVLGVDATLAPLALGVGPTPTLGRIGVSLDGACELADLQFQAHATANALALIAELNAAGLANGPLAPYFPPGMSFAIASGAARAKLRASAQRSADGALLATLELDDAALLDNVGAHVLALERARGEVRVAADGAVEVRELRALGVRASVEREPSGATRVAGLRIAAAESAAPPAPSSGHTSEDADTNFTAATGAAATSAHIAAGRSEQAQDSAQRPAAESGGADEHTDVVVRPRGTASAAPRVVVGDIELELSELTLRGFAGEPLTLALRAEHVGPRTWLAPTLDGAQDIELALRGALAPVCGEFQLALRASPCASQPQFALDFALRELSGAAFARLAPALAERIDASALAHGELSGRVRAQLELRRSAPLELDLEAPLGFEAALEQLEYRADPQGELLAGLRALRIEGGSLDVREKRLRLASVEIDTPHLRATRDAHALQAFGVRFLTPSAAEADTPAQLAADAPAATSATPTPLEAPAFDVVVERAVATGLDVEFVDLSGPAPARLPLDELDAELKRVSLAGLARGDALSFRATLGAGAVDLPVRVSADSLLEGMAAGVVDLLDGEDNLARSEPRPLFAELNLSGKIALAPAPRGWAALNLEALELPAFRGPALATGLELGDGTADLDVRLRLAGADGMSVDARSSFAHLSLSEPADGPLARYLSLPAPLDTVLFLLKDAEGLHKLSLGFRVERDGLKSAEIAGAAAAAATGVIARAVASSPLRLLSTLTDAAGLTGDEAPPQANRRVVEFAAGDPTLDARGRAVLAQLGEDVRGRPRKRVVVVHELSRADLERVARLVNPSLDDRARLAARLRERKAELTRERETLAARARSELAFADPNRRAELMAQLRGLDAQIGEGERALERLFELLRPGSERRNATRARGAAIALGAERADRARRALADLGVTAERVIVRVVKADAIAELEGGGRLTLWAQ
ncbi:MAG: DUF748 domain-containing protein [Planctomycetes bacterium]|nr:DUF748 domain-containing protein [Planctomycetota bacterium]